MIDSEFLEKGKKYEDLPEVHIYYIAETDIFKRGQVYCPVEKYMNTQETKYNDGMNVIYINAEIDDGSEVAELMAYFKTADPDDESHGALSERIKYLKKEEGGYQVMCKIVDEIYQYGEKYGREIGEESGLKRLNSLNRKLQADGRIEDLLKSIEDVVFQQKLLSEYDL